MRQRCRSPDNCHCRHLDDTREAPDLIAKFEPQRQTTCAGTTTNQQNINTIIPISLQALAESQYPDLETSGSLVRSTL